MGDLHNNTLPASCLDTHRAPCCCCCCCCSANTSLTLILLCRRALGIWDSSAVQKLSYKRIFVRATPFRLCIQPFLLSLQLPFISVTGVIRCLIMDNSSSQVGNHLFHSLLVVCLTWLSCLLELDSLNTSAELFLKEMLPPLSKQPKESESGSHVSFKQNHLHFK